MSKNAVIANLDMNVRGKVTDLEKNLKKGEGYLLGFQKVGTGVASSLKRIGEQAAGTFAGFVSANVLSKMTSGVTGLVDKFIALGQEQFTTILATESLATILGVSGNTLRAFALAAERATLGQAELESALVKTAKNVKDGEGALDELGLSYAALQSMPVDRQFLSILEAIEKIPDANKRVQMAMELWGKSGAQILQASSAGFRQAEKDVGRFGLALSDFALVNIDKLHVSITNMMARIKGMASQMLAGIAPSVSAALDKLGEFWDKIGSREVAQRVLNVVETVLNKIIEGVNSLAKALGGIEGTFLNMERSKILSDLGGEHGFWGQPGPTMGEAWREETGPASLRLKQWEKERDALNVSLARIDERLEKINSGTVEQIPALNLKLPAEPMGPTGPDHSGALAKLAEQIAGPAAIRNALAAANMMSRVGQVGAMARSSVDIPQTYGTLRQGSPEAVRAIFDAERSYREGLKSEDERRHKELVKVNEGGFDRVERAVNKLDIRTGQI